MADLEKKLKKRFAANSKPLEPVTFFIDRSLGKKTIAGALRAIGVPVEIHDDHFPIDAKDETWLKTAGEKGWVVLTKDDQIRYHNAERAALIEARVCAFILGTRGLQGKEMAEIFINLDSAVGCRGCHREARRAVAIQEVSGSGLLHPAPAGFAMTS